MKKILSWLLAAALLCGCMAALPAAADGTAVAVKTGEKTETATDADIDAMLRMADFADYFYGGLSVSYICNEISNELTDWDFENALPVPASRFEALLYRMFSKETIEAKGWLPDIRESFDYDPETEYYYVDPYGGWGGMMADREFYNYTVTDGLWHLYFREILYSFLDYETAESLKEDEYDWQVEYEGKTYEDGPEGWYCIDGLGNEGLVHTFAWINGYPCFVSTEPFDMADLPENFPPYISQETLLEELGTAACFRPAMGNDGTHPAQTLCVTDGDLFPGLGVVEFYHTVLQLYAAQNGYNEMMIRSLCSDWFGDSYTLDFGRRILTVPEAAFESEALSHFAAAPDDMHAVSRTLYGYADGAYTFRFGDVVYCGAILSPLTFAGYRAVRDNGYTVYLERYDDVYIDPETNRPVFGEPSARYAVLVDFLMGEMHFRTFEPVSAFPADMLSAPTETVTDALDAKNSAFGRMVSFLSCSTGFASLNGEIPADVMFDYVSGVTSLCGLWGGRWDETAEAYLAPAAEFEAAAMQYFDLSKSALLQFRAAAGEAYDEASGTYRVTHTIYTDKPSRYDGYLAAGEPGRYDVYSTTDGGVHFKTRVEFDGSHVRLLRHEPVETPPAYTMEDAYSEQLSAKTAGVAMESSPYAFPISTELQIEEVTEGDTYETVADVMQSVAERFTVYDLSAVIDTGSGDVTPVQPDGTVTVTFTVPVEYDFDKVAVFYIAADGTRTRLPAVADPELGTLSVTLTHFSTYVLAECDTVAGDVNADGKIDSTDARLILQYYAKKIGEGDLNTAAADVNGDSKIDSTDARLILQLYAKKISAFPVA